MDSQNLVPGTKAAPENLGSVLVVGLGKSGRAVADYCLDRLGERVQSVTIVADSIEGEAAIWARGAQARGAQVGDSSLLNEDITFDYGIVSPGISESAPLYQRAAQCCKEFFGEVEFAWRESSQESRWVAVTGTNGKTTVTALIAHLLSVAGLEAEAVGNIGDTCIEAVAQKHPAVYVAETSSYQLASIADFAPQVAVVLNITPDHLLWHGSFEAYAQAKWNILKNLPQVPESVAVLDAVDDEVRAKIRELKSQDAEQRGFAYIPVGTAKGARGDMRQACGADAAAFVDDQNTLVVAFEGADHRVGAVEELQIKGAHNIENALAAAAAAVALGVADESIVQGLRSFAPIAHRIEPAGVVAGVACYNDSKATNVASTLVALKAFEPQKPLVLLGGRDKMTDLGELVEACKSHAKAVVCFGEARERFVQAFAPIADTLPVLEASGLEDALDCALNHAEEGDIVLLSPACASFDEFSRFEERGDVFKHWVAERAKKAGC